jgi:hypothetical protein
VAGVVSSFDRFDLRPEEGKQLENQGAIGTNVPLILQSTSE